MPNEEHGLAPSSYVETAEGPVQLSETPNKGFDFSRLIVATGVGFGADKFENPIVLFPNEWSIKYFTEKNPELKLHALPLEQTK